MIIVMLFISGLILSGTAVAGLLMVYQIQGATNLEGSGRAIFAADAGIESALYCFYQVSLGVESRIQTFKDNPECTEGNVGSGTAYIVAVQFEPEGVTDPQDITGYRFQSTGASGRTERALEMFISVENP